MNTLKITPEEYLKMTDQALESVTWCPTGFYYNGSREYSKNPLYHAGLYYIQEPSAMSVSYTHLDVYKRQVDSLDLTRI